MRKSIQFLFFGLLYSVTNYVLRTLHIRTTPFPVEWIVSD